MAIIEVRNLTKQFGAGDVAVEVLKGVNLTIEVGEFVALMGPSGSGKSTLMNIIGGIEPPTSGQVLLDGVDIGRLDDDARTLMRRRKIGFIFQAFNLIPTLNALENVALPLQLDGVSFKQAKERAAIALERVEMSHRVDHIPSKLSGGEQQRVAFCRALANGPKLLLADEPTGNLDPATSDQVFGALMDLVRETGLSALIATHNMDLAARMDRVVRLDQGRVVGGPLTGGALRALLSRKAI